MSRPSALCLALFLLAACPCAHAAINLDLSYVNTSSPEFARFKAYVDRAVGGNFDYGFSAADAAYLYRITNQTQYATLAVSLVDAQVTAAESAIAGGHAPDIAGDSYLDVGPMLLDLALTYDWCAAQTTSTQRTHWSAYAEQAVWNVWHPTQAQWQGHSYPWSGWAIDQPGNNYFYSFVEATMYWGLAENSSTWLDLLAIDKLPQLENYFAAIDGGGSQEGTGYGLSHRVVFSLYRSWRDAATGHPDVANTNSHLTDSIAWWIHATVPTRDRVAAIGDQSRVSEPVIYDYHRDVMLEARAMTTDATAKSNASWWLHSISDQTMQSSFNYRFNLLPAGDAGMPPAALTYYAPGTGQLFSRTGWDIGALWLQFAAGPYVQSHAHQDQGSFTLFQGDWLAVTENIWTHSGIQQGTDTNNVVRFEHGGAIVPQREGTTSSTTVTPGANGDVHAVANLTPAYGTGSAVTAWQRTIDFAARKLTVHDAFTMTSGTQAVFQVNVPTQPIINGKIAKAGDLTIRVLSPANATLTALDWTTQNTPDDTEFRSGWRLDVAGSTTGYVVELDASGIIFADGFD